MNTCACSNCRQYERAIVRRRTLVRARNLALFGGLLLEMAVFALGYHVAASVTFMTSICVSMLLGLWVDFYANRAIASLQVAVNRAIDAKTEEVAGYLRRKKIKASEAFGPRAN